MNLMICLRGDDDQLPYIKEIESLGAGIELGSYGMHGIQSADLWNEKEERHLKIAESFKGRIAAHGPFIGIEYDHIDCLLGAAIKKRLDMFFDTAVKLKASRVILHSGYRSEIDLFSLQDYWYSKNSNYWKREIIRWADAGIQVVLENEIEKSPDMLIKLIDEINNPYLGICTDVGHVNLFSKISPSDWVKAVGKRLYHVHLHDNDGIKDRHWKLGKGNIDVQKFLKSVMEISPDAWISLEVDDAIENKMADLRSLASK
ncbi:MAG: sugar phosphate isomerase/epimerase [Fibrobacteres bacterium]|nr:sugar phosphate isomerase/epimerase [Fibrobacterota bacterium]